MLTLAADPIELHAVRVRLTRVRRDVADLIALVETWSCTADDDRFPNYLIDALDALTAAAIGAAAAVVGLDADSDNLED
ncbi:hypothetical protein [Pseudonocardia sp. 73-21]|uniref:hypothetical protein n=1 Tax=Pseudonocardia sp. 73-21 TaxID=1895809 RepID=UPI0009652433|nr:hypothetical protein [Pseudonocardia sp. 73-21]OJY40310.1 MAG: hypothetical protein BGP03_00395 [Pseudonocardia sp. 73-21]